MSRRRSQQQILRMRRQPATTGTKPRIRSMRKNTKGAASDPTVAIDSFVEDSQQESLQVQYSVRKPPRRRAEIGASDLPAAAVSFIRLTLLESLTK